MSSWITRGAAMLVLVTGLLSCRTARAASATWSADADLVLTGSGITLKISSGSEADSLTVNALDFTVAVGAGDTFIVRYPGPNYGTMTNDGDIDSCNIVDDDNVAIVTGPKTVVFTPSTVPCTPASGVGGGFLGPAVRLYIPAVGSSVNGGTIQYAQWTVVGTQVKAVRLMLSIDGARNQVAYVTDMGRGFADWTVPMSASTQAIMTAEALDMNGQIMDSNSQGPFAIIWNAPTAPSAESAYSPATAAAASSTIDIDKGLTGAAGLCAMFSLIKLPDDGNILTQRDSTVYYCGADGKRHAFPNPKTYDTWYADFSGVVTVDAVTLATIQIGDDVTYRPGVRMLKIQSDPKVYAVDQDGLLRWVADQAAAVRLYGSDWNTMVDDLPDDFFVDYRVGETITG